ncbi:AraC family transcriptional regulator [Caproiciproducens sp. LBM24188]|jgi:AraC-like DNA-binding protein|nr:helix-turn-helix domain-containing protein [Oscillospiraceae bacterium]HHV32667.1 AraC family transcriptional regulator [Clostridiales bacterium]
MDQEIMRKLMEITEEEQGYLQKRREVDKSIYSEAKDFVVDSRKLLRRGKLIDVRPNARFVHFPKHRHNYIEIVYMCSGKTTHIINSTSKVELRQGDLLFFNQHTFHEILPASQNDIAINFIVLPEFFDVAFQMIEKDNVIGKFLVSTLCQEENEGQYLYFSAASVIPVQNLVENLVWSILNRQNNNDKVNQYTMGLLFMHLLNRADLIDSGSIEHYENRLVFTALKYIEDHYRSGTLTDLAAQVNQSVYKLSRLLQAATGSSFKELLQQKRLNKAVQLLNDTNLSVSDIINAVGYDNTSYFYRIFRSTYGVSPKEYRRR